MAISAITKGLLWADKVGTLVWVTFRQVDGLGSPLVRPYAAEDLPFPSTFGPGPTPGQVVAFGQAARTASDIKGRNESASTSITLGDPGGEIRAWFSDARQRNMVGLEVSIDFSLTGDRVGGKTPAPNWHGLIKSYRSLAGGKFQFDACDLLSSLQTAPVPMPNAKDYFSGGPDRVGPRWYGHLSDEAADTVSGVPAPAAEAGMGCTAAAAASTYVSPVVSTAALYGNTPPTFALAGFSPMPIVGTTAPPAQVTGLVLTHENLSEPGGPGSPGDWPGNNRGIEGGYRLQVRAIKSSVPGDPYPWTLEDALAFLALDAPNEQLDVNWTAPAGGADSYEVCQAEIALPTTPTRLRPEQIVPVATAGMGSGSGNGIYAVPNPNTDPIDPATIQTASSARLPDFASHFVYKATAVTATGETAASESWINRPDPWGRPIRLCFTPVTGATEYHVYRAPLNDDGSVGTFTLMWVVSTGSTNSDGNIVFTDDLAGTGATTVSGIGGIAGGTGGTKPTQGVVPGFYIAGPFVDATSVSWDGLVVIAAHAIKQIIAAYSRDSSGNVTALAALIDSQISLPGFTGFSTRWGATTYQTFGGWRWTVAYVKGTLAADLLSGKQTAWFNLDGVEATGDGTGTLLESPVQFLAHLLDNDILPLALNQSTYSGGNWATTPPNYGDGRAARNTSSFSSVSTSLASLLGSDVGAFGITSQTACADLVAALAVDADSAHYPDENGAVALLLESPDPDAIPLDDGLTELSEIAALSLSWEDKTTNDYCFNRLTYTYAPSWDASGSTTAPTSVTLTNSTAVTNMRGRLIDASETLAFLTRRDSTSAGLIALRVMARAAPAPRDGTLTVGLFALSMLQIGSVVPITHSDLIGDPVNMQVRGVSTDWDRNAVTLTVRGLATLAIPTTTTVPNVLVEYSASDQNVPVEALVAALFGPAPNAGTVTFQLCELDGVTPVGSPVSGPVVAGVADAVYVLPGGTGA